MPGPDESVLRKDESDPQPTRASYADTLHARRCCRSEGEEGKEVMFEKKLGCEQIQYFPILYA